MAVEVLFAVVVILVAAKLGGELAERLRQPAVLGELAAGILLGAAMLGKPLGLPDVGHAGGGEVLSFLALLGAILLLFQVGLESELAGLRKVLPSSLGVAALGMVVSFAVGYAASWGLGHAWPPWNAAAGNLSPQLLHVFVGATLTATSVGITARVLADLRRLRSPEARVILGAAVLDDVGGLLVLAVVVAMIHAAQAGTPLEVGALLAIAGTAVGFLLLALVGGLLVVPRLFDAVIDRGRLRGLSVTLGLAFAIFMSWWAARAGLSEIVGAFAAGLVLARTRHGQLLRQDLQGMAAVFVGFFFVTLGMRVDLSAMEGHGWAVLAIGLALGLAAILAKVTSGLGVLRGHANRLVVGVGMSPRGEVGLLFASIGLGAGLLAGWQYTALLVVVLVTTFITPLWLRRLVGSFTGPPDAVPTRAEPLGDMP